MIIGVSQILKETLDCERIATVLKLALIGQDEFKKDLTELSSQIQPIKEYLCREAKVDDKKFEIVLEKLTQILS